MKICIVENSPLISDSISRFLKKLKHCSFDFTSVAEMMSSKSLNALEIDAVILDVCQMDDKNLRLIRNISRRFKNGKIIIISSSLQGFPAEKAFKSGVYTYLQKPVSLNMLDFILLKISEDSGKQSKQLN